MFVHGYSTFEDEDEDEEFEELEILLVTGEGSD